MKSIKKKINELKAEKRDSIEKELKGMQEKNMENINIDNANNNLNNNIKNNEDIEVVYNLTVGNTEININTMKYKQFARLLDTKLFSIYLQSSYQIILLFSNLQSFLCNNFDYFCYFIMLVDHMINASLLTMLYPLSIFGYALLENPRPKKIYWQFCICYTIFILSVKFFFQLKLFNNIFDKERYEKFLDDLYNYKVGITYFESGFGLAFFKYIAFDAFALIILALNRNLLISNGLWDKREEQIESIYTANERVETNKDKQFKTQEEEREFIKKFISLHYRKKNLAQEDNENIENEDKINIIKDEEEQLNLIKNEEEDSDEEIKKKLKFNTKKISPKYDEGNKNYIQKLFPKMRNEKPGDDYYPYNATTLALIIIYILFFFTKMDQDKTYGPVNLDTTQFSGNMVLFLILHVCILVYDRAIYICQNKNHLKYRYFIYKKDENGECEILSKEEYKKLKDKIMKNDEDENEKNKDKKKKKKKKKLFIPPSGFEKLNSENYNLFYVQTELFNMPLLHKYFLHIFATILCHIFVFIYFPMKGNFNLLNTIYCNDSDLCNDFSNNIHIIFFYLIYLIYLFLSSLQIRFGYFDIKRKSLFKKNTAITNNIAKIFNAIPFLPNIRNTVDWTFTSTCLDLFQWNKFESIYDTMFDTFCDSEGNDDNKIGEKVSKKRKIALGGILSFALIFVLVVPLVLFSSLNPTNKLNNLTSAKFNVDLTFTYENGVKVNYNLFENERARTITNMLDDVWTKYEYDDSVHTRNFNKKQIQIVKFSETSDRNWDLAEPHIEDLIDLLNITENNGIALIELNIQTEFERPLPAETQTVSYSFSAPIYDSSDEEKEVGINKTLILKKAIENCEDKLIEFDQIYTPALRVTAGEDVSEIEDKDNFMMKGIQLGFQGCRKENETIGDKTVLKNSYLKSYFTFKANDTEGNWEGVEFHIFNDKISETTSGYSVLTFYLTFVLVAGSYVQEFLASEPEKIMFTELPHPEHIVSLCEGIQISRYSYDFKNEEYLFTILIELMRSPDYLKLLTQSSIDQFKVRESKQLKEEEEEEDDDKKKKKKNKKKKDKEKKKKSKEKDEEDDDIDDEKLKKKKDKKEEEEDEDSEDEESEESYEEKEKEEKPEDNIIEEV